MIPELSNLPSRGLLTDPTSIAWQQRPATRFVFSSHARAPEQVLEPDNTTEALVRILKRQHVDGTGQGHAQQSAKGKGVKRAADGEQQPAGGSAQKKLATFSANLVAGVGGRAGAAGASASGAAAPQGGHAAGPSGSGSDVKRVFTLDELKGKTVKELQDVLKARGLPVSGKKDVLMQRMVDYQRRQKLAAMGSQGA